MDTDYITLRKKNTGSLTNLSVLTNDDEKTLFDTTMMSIPDSLHDYNDDDTVNDLNEQINTLKMQLSSAHQEIDDLNSENFRLKSDLQKALKTVETCKKICVTPGRKNSTPSSSSKQKSEHYKIRPTASNNESQTSIKAGYCKDKKVHTLNKETQTSEVTNDTLTQKQNLTSHSHLGNIALKKPVGVSRPKPKNRLAIMSNRCTKGVLPLIEEVFSNDFDYCHYLLHNATTEGLLRTVEDNLKGFTMQDYCLIFIGENDIKSSEYLDILENLKNSLKNTTHTNIVICAPTYIRGAQIHNYKVELFNNRLSLDIKTNKFAYFFDSNYTLTLDMFTYHTGKINKDGWRAIFDQIRSNIFIDYDQDCTKVNDNIHLLEENHNGTSLLSHANENNSCSENTTGFFRN